MTPAFDPHTIPYDGKNYTFGDGITGESGLLASPFYKRFDTDENYDPPSSQIEIFFDGIFFDESFYGKSQPLQSQPSSPGTAIEKNELVSPAPIFSEYQQYPGMSSNLDRCQYVKEFQALGSYAQRVQH